jgi:6-phosphogluconolactonase
MRLEVYQTDAEAFEATATLVAQHVRRAAAPAAIALSGGRDGRGVMLALAASPEVPWERVEWLWGDERCVPPGDPASNVRVARDSLLGPRSIAPDRVHAPPLELGDPAQIAAAYAGTLVRLLGPAPALDVVLLGVGRDGHIASLMPGSAALRATGIVVAVPEAEVSEEPRVARLTITPSVIAAARHVVVTVTGGEKAPAVAAAMRDPLDPGRIPAQLVRPSERVTWIVDRAAAAELLRDARPTPGP